MNAFEIRRILVAFDASADSRAALEAAISLAAALGAEIAGLFVEDIDLLHMSHLPFAQEVPFPIAVARKVDSSEMERQLRAQATWARRQLAEAAERQNVIWSFRVVRGMVAAELMAAAAEADLLALGRVSRTVVRPAHALGSTARTIVLQASQPVLVMRAGMDLNRPVLLIYDGTEPSERALTVAAHLAQVSGVLRILLCVRDDDSARAMERHINERAASEEIRLDYRHLYRLDMANLAYILKLSGVELLVVGNTVQLPVEDIQAMMEELEHPVLVVR